MFEAFKRQIQPLINIYHLFKAILANVYYGFPSKKLKVIGVTGTDGKTTTVFLIYHILKSAGKKVSMVSSIYAKIGEEEFSTGLHVTTPDAILTQKLLKSAGVQGSEYFILETTSHALDQNRSGGIRFDVGLITNITHEHLDYHKTYERYVKAKAKLLLNSKISLINKDDSSAPQLINILKSQNKTFYAYGLKQKADFRFDSKKEVSKDISDFNNYNFLAAYSAAALLKIPEAKVIQALRTFRLPAGRLETIYDKDFRVIIDFAHTPASINNVLAYIKNWLGNNGRLIHVFGSAGLRDYQKRPLMGEASATYADIIILTEEDYRTEIPEEVCRQIAEGINKKGKNHEVIIDRQKAINKAVSLAKKGDIIVLTGKSHEQSLARGKKEYPWDEKKAVFEAINKYDKV